jgi:hypothetical protein
MKNFDVNNPIVPALTTGFHRRVDKPLFRMPEFKYRGN